MNVSELINQPYPEKELLQIVAERVCANFQTQTRCYWMKLEKVDATKSKITWFKAFDERADFTDFSFSFKNLQYSIAVVRKPKHYAIILAGFTVTAFTDVNADGVKNLPSFKPLKNREFYAMPPRSLIERGFADFGGQFRAQAKRSA